jgi:hypothetical protein
MQEHEAGKTLAYFICFASFSNRAASLLVAAEVLDFAIS